MHKTLEKIKVYSDEINYEVDMIKDNKELKIIPLRHLGTPKYYDNLKGVLSKYQNLGYVVFYEIMRSNNANDIVQRKFRKILPLKINLDSKEQLNYKEILLKKSRKIDPNFEFKQNVIPQPQYNFLITDLNNSKNVDITIEEFVNEYERLNGAVVLDSCDYINNWSESTCETDERAKGLNKIMIDYRNNNVVDNVLSATNNKILILYGEGHVKGIKKGLLKNGYKLNK